MCSQSSYEQELETRVLDNLGTSILLFDESLRLKYINPAGEMLFAATKNQLTGRTVHNILPKALKLHQSLKRSLESGHPITERELHINFYNQTELTVDCMITPLKDAVHGSELLMELVQLDRHLRITREENLLSQHQLARTVVRGLAHEIKNPLGGLRGAAQLLERELPNDELKEYTGIIIDEADRLQNLLNRLLGPTLRPQRRMMNIHEVLERVRSVMSADMPAGIIIRRDYDPSIPDFVADPEQLIQATLNIVRNAVQALGDHGSITLRTRTKRQFTIGPKRHKLVLNVDIIDNGPGVPEDILEKIFYPMVTGRPEGTGLGLSIAQNLVNQEQGLIECTSKPGCTMFTILLPLEIENE